VLWALHALSLHFGREYLSFATNQIAAETGAHITSHKQQPIGAGIEKGLRWLLRIVHASPSQIGRVVLLQTVEKSGIKSGIGALSLQNSLELGVFLAPIVQPVTRVTPQK
jgi:hypothetical protein